jgi:hypothetical protein
MADPTIDDLYKSLAAADAAGDTKSAQILADYIRSLPTSAPKQEPTLTDEFNFTHAVLEFKNDNS